MPKTYKISAENAAEIKEIRKTITDKKVDRRLHAVQLRGEGLILSISLYTFSSKYLRCSVLE